MTIGLDRPIIVVSTGMVELLDLDGLRFVLGHEVGHVLSGHALHRTMLIQLINLSAAVQWLPIGAWGMRAIVLALNEWYRKSELFGDRAGLLCGQDPAAAVRGRGVGRRPRAKTAAGAWSPCPGRRQWDSGGSAAERGQVGP